MELDIKKMAKEYFPHLTEQYGIYCIQVVLKAHSNKELKVEVLIP